MCGHLFALCDYADVHGTAKSKRLYSTPLIRTWTVDHRVHRELVFAFVVCEK